MTLPVLNRERPAERWDPFRELEELDDRFATMWDGRTRTVGRIHYAVTLPSEVDDEHGEASLRNGVLTVRVPKSSASRRRRVTITR